VAHAQVDYSKESSGSMQDGNQKDPDHHSMWKRHQEKCPEIEATQQLAEILIVRH